MSESPDVGRRTFRAVAWNLLSSIGKRVMTLVGLTLLARVLVPHDFGLFGFAMVYLTFVEVIGDFGTAAALVYWPERREDAAQMAFLINVVAGLFWFLISFTLAPYIAAFFHAPGGTTVLRALAFISIAKFFGNTHDALAQKDLRFQARTIPEVALTTVRAVVSLVLAYLGYGVWSLVWGHAAGIVSWTVLEWVIVPWRPALRIPRDLFAPMLRYGRSIVAVHLLAAVMFDIDIIVVGRFLGVTALGLYQMAARVPDSSVMVLIWVVGQALFPALSQLHAEGADVKGAYLVATRCVASLTLPASLGLCFLARPIMLSFFGPKWGDAAPILSMLAIYVGFRAVDEVGNVLKATGRTNVLVWLTLLRAVLLVPAVVIGAMFSAVAVALALTIVNGIGTIITTLIAARVVEIPIRSILAAFARSSQAAIVMSVALFGWMRWSTALLPVAQLAGGVVLGGVVYIAALRFIDPEIFAWSRALLLRKKSPAAA